jgi:hypothetical protein
MMDATPLYQHAYDPVNPTMRRDWQGRAKTCARSLHSVRYYFVDFAHAISGHPWNSSAMQARYGADVFELGDILRTNFFDVRCTPLLRPDPLLFNVTGVLIDTLGVP